MKSFALIGISLLLLGCTQQKNTIEQATMAEYTGLLEAQGITSYQYGTHTLKTKNSFYALRSDTINLNKYLGKTITLIAKTFEGYPLDNGPVYLNVIKVKP